MRRARGPLGKRQLSRMMAALPCAPPKDIPVTAQHPAPDRLPPIPVAAYTPEQEKAAAEFRARRGVEPFGPYAPLLRSPQIMIDVATLGRRLRYESSLPKDLKEQAVCQVARAHTQQFEWSVHVHEARKDGVPEPILAAIAEGRRPDDMTADQALMHDAVTELMTTKRWSDTTYARVTARFGERGAVEIPALIGLYSLLALVLNVARTPPDGDATLVRFPE
jgi:4-carboxymuconolactone decarboxylase